LGQLAVGDTIYLMIGSAKNLNYDLFANFNFNIEKLTTAAAMTNTVAMSSVVVQAVPEPSGASLSLAAVGVGALARRKSLASAKRAA
jgi:hypothetical protein